MRRPILLGVLAALTAVGAAGLVLAQDPASNSVAPATPPDVAPPVPTPLPPLAVPPPEPAPVPPPQAQSDNAADSDDDKDTVRSAAADTDHNAVAEAPAAPPPPPQRPRYGVAVLQALDKVTADTLRFEAKVDEPVRYKDLVITVHACETSAKNETFPEAAAHLDVQYQPDILPGAKGPGARRIYQGWMFAQSPGLHPLQHPIYDLWVIACRTPSTPAAAPAGASL